MGLVKPAWPVLQRGHPLARGLVAAYPLYEGAGNTIYDLGDTAKPNVGGAPRYNGTFAVAPSWVGTPFGSGLKFDGSSQYITIPFINWNVGSSNPEPISIALWINTPGNTAGGSLGCSNFGLLGAHLPYSDNNIYWDYGNQGGGRISTSFSSFLNQWALVVLTNDGVAAKAIYINGTLVASNTTANGSGATSFAHIDVIGQYLGGGGGPYYFNGSMADLRIYNRVLSAAEIAQLYFDPFAIYRKPSRWWETATAAAPPAYVPYNPWPLQAPVLAQ